MSLCRLEYAYDSTHHWMMTIEASTVVHGASCDATAAAGMEGQVNTNCQKRYPFALLTDGAYTASEVRDDGCYMRRCGRGECAARKVAKQAQGPGRGNEGHF